LDVLISDICGVLGDQQGIVTGFAARLDNVVGLRLHTRHLSIHVEYLDLQILLVLDEGVEDCVHLVVLPLREEELCKEKKQYEHEGHGGKCRALEWREVRQMAGSLLLAGQLSLLQMAVDGSKALRGSLGHPRSVHRLELLVHDIVIGTFKRLNHHLFIFVFFAWLVGVSHW